MQASEIVPLDVLEDVVRQAQQGDRTALPAIRLILDKSPVLWEEASRLASQVERRWLQVLSGTDLLTQEVLVRQVAEMKSQLAGLSPSPLEQLLVDQIIVCWLQVQQAELRSADRLSKNGYVLSNAEENRLDKVNRRFLTAVKSLAQVRKLLTPKVQLNIANQQVNIS
jgi:hypothetical protein